MLQIVSTVLLVLAGLVNFAPLVGVVSAERLHGLYGLSFEDPSLEILMRHRAVLFGLVGGLILVSAFHAPLRTTGMLIAFVSMVAYLGLVLQVGDANAALARLFRVDLAATIGLVIAFVLDRIAGVPL